MGLTQVSGCVVQKFGVLPNLDESKIVNIMFCLEKYIMKKLFLLTVVILMVTGVASARTAWRPDLNETGGDPNFVDVGYWNVAENWDNGIPTPTEFGDPCDPANQTGKAVFYHPNAKAECWVNTPDAVCYYFVAGDNEPMVAPLVIKDGGTLTTGSNWSGISYNESAHLIVEEGGTLNCGQHLWVAMNAGADATFDINGGTVNVNTAFDVGRKEVGTKALVSVNSGLLSVEHVTNLTDSGWYKYNGGVIDVSFGTFKVRRNLRSWNGIDLIATQIASGQLTAFGGLGTISDEYVDSWTIITANDPMERYPTWDDKVPNTGLTFSWKNLDPNNPADAVWVDVYYGKDPNNPNQWTKLSTSYPNQESVAVGDLPVADDYLWQVNSYIYGQPIQYGGTKVYDNNDLNPDSFIDEGLLIPFATQADYMAPEVVIDSNDILTWNDYPVTLTATITDEGVTPVDYVWSSDNDPNITFSEMTPASPLTVTGSATVTVKVTGTYQQPNSIIRIRATITVNDQTNPEHNSDTMSVYLAKDACSAARENASGGWPRLDLVYTADFDGDCDVDLADLLVVVRQWLDPYELEEPIQIP